MFSQGSIPEVKEDNIGHALNERKLKIPQFQDLGPPDLLTMVKYVATSSSTAQLNSNSNSNGNKSENFNMQQEISNTIIKDLYNPTNNKGEIGTFFYTVGVDTNDPTSISVFLKKIADTISEEPQAWFGKTRNFNVARITLSTWNSFRRCDMNIVVHIPGNLHTYILDIDGELLQVNPTLPSGEENPDFQILWIETFMSGMVRSVILMKDNAEEGESQNLVETLVLNPFTSGEINTTADNFIELFPFVYEKGPLLGAPVYVTNVTRSNNYLVETLIEIVKLTHSLDQCRTMLEKVIQTYPEAVVVLIRILFACEMEIDAIQLLNEQLQKQEETTDVNFYQLEYKADMLAAQAEFLLDVKHDYEFAKEVANAVVSCSPSEFKPWYLLAKSYVKVKDIENALLTLNSCPMSPLKEKYGLKRVVPIQSDANLHLPLPVDVVLDEVSSLNPQDIQREHKSADPVLVRLAASNLKSTFQLVYKLLTEIVKITDWESLLKYRSNIFVMEEEYQTSAENTDTENSNAENGVENGLDAGTDSSVKVMLSTTDLNPSQNSSLRSKRLCERWLDNLFMLLYDDLKTYTLFQSEQQYFEAQNADYNKLTIEWELFGLCARRLGHYSEAARAFQIGLSQRFSSGCARRLLEYCVKESIRVKNISNNPDIKVNTTTEEVTNRIKELNSSIIDLCVKICCWNHRWYIEFSIQLIEALSIVIQDMGITMVTNEIAARYSETVAQLMKDNLITFFENYTNQYYDA
ncbi:hypothetical protein TPHA_0G01220 [Tetrapisispora phaffii CBS 4417]|uniref:Uncharacterized protein n=1 Tax=Tetrapisispora phaffii (strain ATCC 24235 / CBS 4417 / NBRC 1672 / NRRL Y-8282 / UCD 70-5) TaxID=1071381 RepID=G8BVN1_TETPH|nr:hypothetical protein TPHA_0G01220 [Tetrapisispora phaffii CBS 4417]CCE63959.1 hypothetical protein TPHA_0G01220 [Tetrapisispora phaffii CBS 4417]